MPDDFRRLLAFCLATGQPGYSSVNLTESSSIRRCHVPRKNDPDEMCRECKRLSKQHIGQLAARPCPESGLHMNVCPCCGAPNISIQQPPHQQQQQQQNQPATATIIGLSASTLSALNAATAVGTGGGATIASGGATITPVTAGSGGGATVVANQLLKVAAGNNNSISILKIGDDIMLKAVKVEPLPSDTGGGGGGVVGGGGVTATTTGSSAGLTANTVTVTTIPPANGGGHVVFGGKRRHESNEEWISSPSPGSVQGSAPPLSPSPGSQSHTYTNTMSNGYSSPLSSGSYDPYSPNGKMAIDPAGTEGLTNGTVS
uniref:Uncharacterized protein n=1 Tax=Anopheles culicifacies TaxID=139723 RepID=A0A182MRZ8_9DIPT